MCGIFGVVYSDTSRRPDAIALACATDAMQHRGPDDSGVHSAPGVLLGSRRLAILDLSAAGHMPMSTSDGRYWITYNGEVYNFAELRDQLRARGYTFRSDTDTEVLLQLYVDRGADMLHALNGMFAFAIWDSQTRTLFAARDRIGVKPFCYAFDGERLVFASEHKALFAAGVARGFDHTRWEELLCFRFVAGEDTVFPDVKRLLPGHSLTFRDGHLRISKWWDLADEARAKREALPADPVAWYREHLSDSVRKRMISDVPLGVLLSGGLDSSSLAALMSEERGTGVSSFTVRFEESGFDESEFARLVAVRWALDYHDLLLSPSTLPGAVAKASYLNDEPLAHGSDQHLFAIAAFAKPDVTVLLSGEGADETLGGYIRYQPLRFPSLLKASGPVLPSIASMLQASGRLRKLGRFAAFGSIRDMVLFNACDVLPQDLQSIGLTPSERYPYRREVLERAEALYPGDFMRQAMFLDQHSFLCSLLDRNDRMTMGGSIECRVPFLDYRLIEMLAAMPTSALAGSRPKTLLRDALRGALPKPVLRHRKWGFGVPWDVYFRTNPEFFERLQSLHSHPLVQDSPLDEGAVARLVSAYLAGDLRLLPMVKQLVLITMWHDAYMRRPAIPLASGQPVGMS